jgi:hypothetical protein
LSWPMGFGAKSSGVLRSAKIESGFGSGGGN